jgi:hypothetical protein
VREFRTPFDGKVSIGPAGDRKLGYELLIRNRSGKTLRSSRQSRLRVAVRALGKASKPFRLTIQRP